MSVVSHQQITNETYYDLIKRNKELHKKYSNVRAENKPFTSYPEEYVNEIKLLMANKNNGEIMPIGSSTYKPILYSGDLDFLEIYKKGINKENVLRNFEKQLRETIKNITNKKNHWFMELKCGIDHRYDIELGRCIDGKYIMNTIVPRWFREAFDDNLFEENDKKTINDIIATKSYYTQLDYEILKKIVRKYRVIRWNYVEIKNDRKKLFNSDKTITLFEALHEPSKINIEVIAIINGKITDTSNYFILECTDSNGNSYVINNDENTGNLKSIVRTTLTESMEQLYKSKLDKNYMKLAKRLFSYSRLFGEPELSYKILPLLNSPTGLLYKMRGEISTIVKLITNKKQHIPIKILKNELQYVKYHLSNVAYLPNEYLEKINEIIDDLCNAKYSVNNVIEKLSDLSDDFLDICNSMAQDYLENVDLFPLPSKYLPYKREY